MQYNHTQTGNLILAILFMLVGYFGYLLTLMGFNLPVIVIMLFIVLLLGSFSTLNVTIDNDYLKIKFGWGIFRKKFLRKHITSAKPVKNHWYYGWGIRYWVPRKMWIFNVSGFDAVEIEVKGRFYRIGTDEPEKLVQAIRC